MTRGATKESLIDIAVSLHAVDMLLEEGNPQNLVNRNKPAGTSATPAVAQATLKSAWFKWVMEHHKVLYMLLYASCYYSSILYFTTYCARHAIRYILYYNPYHNDDKSANPLLGTEPTFSCLYTS